MGLLLGLTLSSHDCELKGGVSVCGRPAARLQSPRRQCARCDVHGASPFIRALRLRIHPRSRALASLKPRRSAASAMAWATNAQIKDDGGNVPGARGKSAAIERTRSASTSRKPPTVVSTRVLAISRSASGDRRRGGPHTFTRKTRLTADPATTLTGSRWGWIVFKSISQASIRVIAGARESRGLVPPTACGVVLVAGTTHRVLSRRVRLSPRRAVFL